MHTIHEFPVSRMTTSLILTELEVLMLNPNPAMAERERELRAELLWRMLPNEPQRVG